MNRYKILDEIHDGAFGVVFKAVSELGELVAVKKLKHRFRLWQECMELREVKALKRLLHPNVVKLREVIRENDELFLVFEYCETNLFDFIMARKKAVDASGPSGGSSAVALREDEIKLVMFQLLRGLHCLHRNGAFHRDIKPENILLASPVANGVQPILSSYSSELLENVKIGDFALARESNAIPPLTDYVSTRWYRAPEILFKFPAYDWQVDIWAAGVVMAEMFLNRPLFPGTSESDQLHKIQCVLGPPPLESWPELVTLLNYTGASVPSASTAIPMSSPAQTLQRWIPTLSDSAADLLSQMLSWQPTMRPSAKACLKHSYFEAFVKPAASPNAAASS